MIYKELNKNNDDLIEIDSVSSYISKIKQLRESSDGTSTELYFRGQEVEFWNVEPSIFRDDMLSVEHKLIQMPLQKNPAEFKGFDSLFDIMTKYQHYGMCTRLLDLTTNPLVALYFACKKHGNEKYESEERIIKKEPYGVVYFTNNYYPAQPTDKEVQIVTALASYDLSKENTIEAVLNKLENDNLINIDTKKRWLSKEYIDEFIKIIQQNYLVVPTYTNERLKRQNGVFLLASKFNVNISSSIKDGVITKCKDNLRNEFTNSYFYVNGENKKEILKELDLYNVNEATLFPELEHQLNYIKYANADLTNSVADFSKYEDNHDTEEIDVYIDDNKLNEYIFENLDYKLSGIIDASDYEEIKQILELNFTIDWYKRMSSSSKINKEITSFYLKKYGNREEAKHKANRVLAVLNEEVKYFISLQPKRSD